MLPPLFSRESAISRFAALSATLSLRFDAFYFFADYVIFAAADLILFPPFFADTPPTDFPIPSMPMTTRSSFATIRHFSPDAAFRQRVTLLLPRCQH